MGGFNSNPVVPVQSMITGRGLIDQAGLSCLRFFAFSLVTCVCMLTEVRNEHAIWHFLGHSDFRRLPLSISGLSDRLFSGRSLAAKSDSLTK